MSAYEIAEFCIQVCCNFRLRERADRVGRAQAEYCIQVFPVQQLELKNRVYCHGWIHCSLLRSWDYTLKRTLEMCIIPPYMFKQKWALRIIQCVREKLFLYSRDDIFHPSIYEIWSWSLHYRDLGIGGEPPDPCDPSSACACTTSMSSDISASTRLRMLDYLRYRIGNQ